MQAILFNFSKRVNSTKRPNDAQGVSVSVSIKQNVPKGQSSSQSGTETFLSHPTIWVQGDYTEYNYMKFKGRYYFVRDIQLTINNATVLYGEIDALATYKDAIVNSSQYVLYDETTNTEIPDDRLSMYSSCHTNYDDANMPFYDADGSLIVALNGEGNIDYFMVDRGTLRNLTAGFGQWMRDNFWDETPGRVITQLVSSGSIAENVVSAFWMPFKIPSLHLIPVPSLSLGNYDTQLPGYAIMGRIDKENVTIDIPWRYSDWRNREPYTSVYLYLPFVGLVNIPGNQIIGANYLSVDVAIDYYTGDLAYLVKTVTPSTDTDVIVGTYGASPAAALPIGSSNISGKQVSNGIVAASFGGAGIASAFAKIASSTNAAGIAAGVAQYAASIVGGTAGILGSISPLNQTIGGTGSAAGSGLDMKIQCFTVAHDISGGRDGASPFFGTPTMMYKSLSRISGYVQCSQATVDVAATEEFREIINNFLNRGIYIE